MFQVKEMHLRINLDPSRVQALRKAMTDAREAFVNARAVYHRAMAIATDTGANADDEFALRCEGHAYAQALTVYTNATMAWLAYLDTVLRPSP